MNIIIITFSFLIFLVTQKQRILLYYRLLDYTRLQRLSFKTCHRSLRQSHRLSFILYIKLDSSFSILA